MEWNGMPAPVEPVAAKAAVHHVLQEHDDEPCGDDPDQASLAVHEV